MPEIPDRDKVEAAILARLQPQFDEWRDRFATSLGDPPDIARLTPGLVSSFEEDTAMALMMLVGIGEYEAAQLRMATDHDVTVDPGQVRRDAQRWAYSWSKRVAQEFTTNTVKALQEIVRQYAPGTMKLATELAEVLDEKRAGRLVVTELTRVASDGERDFVQRWSLNLQAFWRTARDAKVCPTCAPLDKRRVVELASDFAFGPPAHVNCRCYVEWREPE